jgi:carboxyl-terminal processing protease
MTEETSPLHHDRIFFWRRCRPAAVLLASASLFAFLPFSGAHGAVASKPDLFSAARSIDLLGDVYLQVSENYVDPVNVAELMFAGIDGMLAYLDPYTVFLDEAGSDELDEMTSGRYAGIGIIIGVVSGDLYVTSLLDGYAASNAGLRIGDMIVSVDGKMVKHNPSDELKAAIKGPSGTEVTLGIRRTGEHATRSYTLRREAIRLSSVPFYAQFDGIAYVQLDSFNEHSVEELRSALQEMTATAGNEHLQLKGIVLDLRGNPGGLLTTAVDVTGLFVDKGSRVVSTRGREPYAEQVYVTRNEPIEPALPLAVLIDGDTASASEIVASAIQELDRGVIVGRGSFGKGLVQSIVSLPYDHVLKMTTAKYYTPSGRLIQKPLDHGEHQRKVLEGVERYDSTKVYFTRSRRKVYGGGGVRPDIEVSAINPSDYRQALEKQGMFFRFAALYRSQHPVLQEINLQAGALLREFNRFVEGGHFVFRSKLRVAFDSLRELAGKDDGPAEKGLDSTIDTLEKEIVAKNDRMALQDSSRIASAVRQELLRHYDAKAGRRAAIEDDPVAQRAFSLLRNPQRYRALLKP